MCMGLHIEMVSLKWLKGDWCAFQKYHNINSKNHRDCTFATWILAYVAFFLVIFNKMHSLGKKNGRGKPYGTWVVVLHLAWRMLESLSETQLINPIIRLAYGHGDESLFSRDLHIIVIKSTLIQYNATNIVLFIGLVF